MSISIEALKEAIEIKESIQSLESRLDQILNGRVNQPSPATDASAPKTWSGKMSPAARAKISAGSKARWARVRALAAAAAAPALPRKRRGSLSPEGRARIVAALKARWAAKRKADGTSAKTAPKNAFAPKKRRGTLSPEGRARIVAALKARWAAKRKASRK